MAAARVYLRKAQQDSITDRDVVKGTAQHRAFSLQQSSTVALIMLSRKRSGHHEQVFKACCAFRFVSQAGILCISIWYLGLLALYTASILILLLPQPKLLCPDGGYGTSIDQPAVLDK